MTRYINIYKVRKEIPIAILVGGLVGLVAAYGVWRANIALKKTPSADSGQQQNINDDSPQVSGLSISRPNDLEVFTTDELTVAGVSGSASYAVVAGEDTDYITKLENDGGFEQDLELEGGLNEVLVAVFDKTEKIAEKRILVVYSNKLDTPNPSTSSGQASQDETSDDIRSKIAEITQRPMAYVGAVTDISEESMQLSKFSLEEGQNGDILQVAINENTRFADDSKEIDFEDVAIGDTVIAMGNSGENEVLAAERIVVTSPVKKSARNVAMATVTEYEGNNIVLETPEGEIAGVTGKFTDATSLDEDGEIEEIKLNEVEAGDKVIVVYEQGEKNINVRRVHVVTRYENLQ